MKDQHIRFYSDKDFEKKLRAIDTKAPLWTTSMRDFLQTFKDLHTNFKRKTKSKLRTL